MRCKLLLTGLSLSQWLFIAVLIFAGKALLNIYFVNFVLWVAAFALIERLGLTPHRRQQFFGWLTIGLVLIDAICWYVSQGFPDGAYCRSYPPSGCFLSENLANGLLFSGLFYLPVVLITLVSWLVSWLRIGNAKPELVVPAELLPSFPAVNEPDGAEPAVVRRASFFTPLLAMMVFAVVLLGLLALSVTGIPGPR